MNAAGRPIEVPKGGKLKCLDGGKKFIVLKDGFVTDSNGEKLRGYHGNPICIRDDEQIVLGPGDRVYCKGIGRGNVLQIARDEALLITSNDKIYIRRPDGTVLCQDGTKIVCPGGGDVETEAIR